MKKHFYIFFLIIASNILFANNPKVQQLIHLLDYLGNDYALAVKDGKVNSEQEYKEMQEFALKIQKQLVEIKLDTIVSLNNDISSLSIKVNAKASPSEIKNICLVSKTKIIELTGYITFPSSWPDFTNAEKLYADNCAKCHGTDGRGNGEEGLTLDPAPRNFHEIERLKKISPLQAFNTIRLGVEGTGMQGFSQLTEKEVWDLSFYVTSLYHPKLDSNTIQKIYNQYIDKVSLDQLAKYSDEELTTKFNISDSSIIAAIRLGKPVKEKANFLLIAKNKLSNCYQAYINKDYSQAEQDAISAYLEGIEPIELQVKSLNPHLKEKIEKAMMLVRSDIANKVSPSKLDIDIKSCYVIINDIQTLLDSEKKSGWWSFIMSFSIIIREALEAVLILIIIINIIKNLEVKRALFWVHIGWISALIMGVFAWFFSEKLLEIGMEKIEFFEGVVSFVSVIIVIYIGFWMHQHTEINRWKTFVNDKIGNLVKNENYKGLALLSFIVVGREVFESVLFLSALGTQKHAVSNLHLYIIAGVIVALILVFVLSYIFINYTKNIPIRKLLQASSMVLGLLAVILIGKAIHSFQETGYIPIHSFFINIRVELLGIYPTIESILTQLILSILVVYLLFFHKPKSN